MRPPIFCMRCGAVFASRMMDIRGANFDFQNALWTEPCIRCGFPAQLPEGFYAVIGDAIVIAESPEARSEALRLLGTIAKQAALGEITPEVAAARATEIDPKAGSLIRRLISSAKETVHVLAALAGIAAVFLTYSEFQSAKEAERRSDELLRQIIMMQQKVSDHEKLNVPSQGPGRQPRKRGQATLSNPQDAPIGARVDVRRHSRARDSRLSVVSSRVKKPGTASAHTAHWARRLASAGSGFIRNQRDSNKSPAALNL